MTVGKKRVGITVDMVVYNDLRHDARVYKEAKSLIDKGYSVRVVGMETPDTVPLVGWEGISVLRVGVGASKSLRVRYARFWPRAFRALMRRKATVIHAHDLDAMPPAWLAASLTRAHLVHDAHELWVELPSLVGRPLIRWVWQLLAKALIPRSDATITVCQGIVEEMRARYGVNAAILRNLPLRLGPVSPLPLRERIGCAATTTLVIYQGGLLPGLGIDNAIDAMGLLPDGHLVIIGSGPLRDSLGARCDASPAKARITFLPAVPFKELPAYTAAANIGLFLGDSSGLNLQLALPNKLFEYIAAGVPVVATDWAEVRRIVLRYDVGILVPPGSPASAVADAIRHVAAKRDHYATNCRAAAEELTWENEVAVLGDVYDAVLGGGKTRLAGTRA